MHIRVCEVLGIRAAPRQLYCVHAVSGVVMHACALVFEQTETNVFWIISLGFSGSCRARLVTIATRTYPHTLLWFLVLFMFAVTMRAERMDRSAAA